MTQHEVSFNFQARYFKLGKIDTSTKQVWFVLHGYGQLAQYFIKKFSCLTDKSIAVIAPEGLSHFYLENVQDGTRKNDRVGATWMTKENRLMDIANYNEYLNTVYRHELAENTAPVTILGFSQGSATASRWVMDNKVAFERLILWAGLFPMDMDFHAGRELLKEKAVVSVFGKQDTFINDARFIEMKMLIDKLGVHVKEIAFGGGHDIDRETLLEIANTER